MQNVTTSDKLKRCKDCYPVRPQQPPSPQSGDEFNSLMASGRTDLVVGEVGDVEQHPLLRHRLQRVQLRSEIGGDLDKSLGQQTASLLPHVQIRCDIWSNVLRKHERKEPLCCLFFYIKNSPKS